MFLKNFVLENREKAMMSAVILCSAVSISDVIRKDKCMAKVRHTSITSDFFYFWIAWMTVNQS